MSGASGLPVTSIARLDSPLLSAADNQNVSSLLVGTAWRNASTIDVTITYSFPTSSEVYGPQSFYSDQAPYNGFSPLTAQQQGEAVRAFSLVSSYTGLSFTEITETTDTHAAIRQANSSIPPTAYAYYPGTYLQAGDIFYGGTGRFPVMGNHSSGEAVFHEIGHALGLKHGQDNFQYGVMNADRLDLEFSLMNYASYIGWADGYSTTNQSPQTFMMYDIAALQHMYGANFEHVGQARTYTWSSSTGAEFIDGESQGTPVNNHIFGTIWTGGATSTYDLSNFSQDQVDDMNPGGWMLFSTEQLAHLNAFSATNANGAIHARGNIYNALLYNGDTRSLITNLIAGAGNDTITGNAADNDIHGGAGNDAISGGIGNDSLHGEAGDDTLDGDGGNDLLSGSTGIDLLLGDSGSDTFFYGTGDGMDTVADFSHTDADKVDFTLFAGIASFYDIISRSIQVALDTVIDFGNGDSLTLTNVDMASLVDSDFVLSTVSPAVVLESFGSTSLVQSDNSYFMPPVGGLSGPQLMQDGNPVVPGQFGAWTPIGAEAAETGYLVAWRNGAADEYTVWNTDGNGTYLWDPIGTVAGSSVVLESYEPVFQQDLNGDGQIGAQTTIESFGTTRLIQVADAFLLHDSAGNGPSLMQQDVAVVPGQFDAWTPIGAEAAETGYLVAWKNGAADEFTVWNTDGNGNYLWDPIGTVVGSSVVLKSYEPVFQQDLNGDGTVGLATVAAAANEPTPAFGVAGSGLLDLLLH